MKLVYYTISKYYPTFINNEDIIQEGMLGLCKAADKFDGDKGTTFSTFATMCILNEIRDYWRKNLKCTDVLSLDYEVQKEGYDQCTVCDLIVGDEDISLDLIMCSEFLKTLSDSERELLYLLMDHTHDEVAKKFGMSRSGVSMRKRRITKKWRKFNGDD